MHSIKHARYRIGIKFDQDPLSVEQKNYATKIANAYIVYDLDAWPRIPISNFKFKNCLFSSTNLVKNNDKYKWVYSGYGITFDAVGCWNFGNYLVRDVVFLVVGINLSSHAGNDKNNFGSFVSPEKMYGINFNKANTKFGSVCIKMVIIVTCLLMEKKSLILKLIIKMSTFQLNFV